MTTLLCPRCGAPLVVDHAGTVWCNAKRDIDYCGYGNDAPRTLVPQPDVPVGVAPVSAQGVLDLRRKELDAAYGAGWEAGQAEARMFTQPSPTPQRTDAGGVAPLGWKARDILSRALDYWAYDLREEDADEDNRDLLRGIESARAEIAAQPAPTPTPAANATPAGVDEGMRERVLAVLRKDMPGEYSRMVRLSDGICAAILASHEIVRRPQ